MVLMACASWGGGVRGEPWVPGAQREPLAELS